VGGSASAGAPRLPGPGPADGESLRPSPRWVPVSMGGFLILLGVLVWLVSVGAT
jgi:hypothetical protein